MCEVFGARANISFTIYQLLLVCNMSHVDAFLSHKDYRLCNEEEGFAARLSGGQVDTQN